jgi:hypothetical protein
MLLPHVMLFFWKLPMMHANTALTRIICVGFIAALAATSPLQAQKFKFRFGGQLSVVNPTGYLAERANLGIGADLSFEFCFGSHFAVRQNICYVLFGDKSVPEHYYFGDYELKYKTDSIGFFIDGIFRFNSQDKGLYAFSGLGLLNSPSWRRSYYPDSISEPVIGITAGFGYKFNRNWGIEAKYVKCGSYAVAEDAYPYPDPPPSWPSADSSWYRWYQLTLIQRF